MDLTSSGDQLEEPWQDFVLPTTLVSQATRSLASRVRVVVGGGLNLMTEGRQNKSEWLLSARSCLKQLCTSLMHDLKQMSSSPASYLWMPPQEVVAGKQGCMTCIEHEIAITLLCTIPNDI